MTFQNELKRLREEKGVSQTEFAAGIGVSQSTVGQYESGKCKPRYATIVKIADYFGISVADLTDEKKQNSYRVPVLGSVRAGFPMYIEEEVLDWEEISTRLQGTGEFFGLKVIGDSMEPDFHEGDVVICRQQPAVENGEIAIVSINGDSATIKSVRKIENGIMLVAKNTKYEPQFYTEKEIMDLPVTILAKVVELRRKF